MSDFFSKTMCVGLGVAIGAGLTYMMMQDGIENICSIGLEAADDVELDEELDSEVEAKDAATV